MINNNISNNPGNIKRNNIIILNNNEKKNVIRINPHINNIVHQNNINEEISLNALDEEI